MDEYAELTSWQGTLKEALEQATILVNSLDLDLLIPPERTVRDWRTEGVLTKTGRRFTGRNILEFLRASQLRQEGYPVTLIRTHLEVLNDAELLKELLSDKRSPHQVDAASPPLQAGTFDVEQTVTMLATAVVMQFKQTGDNKIVGIYDDIPLAVRQAQSRLTRIAMLCNEDDRFASIHELMHACTTPMQTWAPKPISEHPLYRDVTLIDENLFVPTKECLQLAQEGGALADVIENQLFQQFKSALNRLEERRRAPIYTRLRGFIAEHPMASTQELGELKRDPLLLNDADLLAFIDHAYPYAHPNEARRKIVDRCWHCQGPIRHGKCRLPSCQFLHSETRYGDGIALDQARIARPALLAYWCDPAQEELRVFRELQDIHGSLTELYPHQDACDISLGEHIGIDVKDHQSPQRLARKLNAGIGGLSRYRQQFLTIASRRVTDDSYIPQLQERLTPALRRNLIVLSVEDTISRLRQEVVSHDRTQ
ncbi:hypothetical protein [Deinococcus altitudinis]|uniref:restriction endonuclease-related protein n=1 Tax=Deinococcus altitudinis TaxID=468914 RepID=UPI003892484A